ncbi:MAG: RNA polymerase sigma factor, partial [Planctomycetaceae bacterium]|nr:RNA polymerase sigma factor [Planctomycetaceae bacterium]
MTSLTHDNNSTDFAELLQPVYGQLQVFCRRSLRCSEDTADVLQAALLTAYGHFDQFQRDSNFRAWIFRYVTFEILNANRARLREPLQLDTEVIVDQQTHRECLATWPELPDFSSMLGEWFDDSVRCAVLELTENERSILLLRAIGEFRYREISEILGLPEGTVMG